MRIVIDLPDDRYNQLMNDDIYLDVPIFKEDVIATLPKGCGRLIDAGKLKQVYETTEDAEYCQWTLYGVTSEIDDAETVIEADSEVAE